MNETILNQTITSQDLQGIWFYLSYLPKYLTENITNLMSKQGWNVSNRWSSYMVFFFSGLLVFAGLKISLKAGDKGKAILKYILIIGGIILICGIIFVPGW